MKSVDSLNSLITTTLHLQLPMMKLGIPTAAERCP